MPPLPTDTQPPTPAEPASGRPWNMTPTQRAKLRQMWIAIFQPLNMLPNDTVKAAPSTWEASEPGRRTGTTGRSTPAASKDNAASTTHARTSSHPGTLTPTEVRDAFWSIVKHHHPDGVLLRFLRARDWDVAAARKMLPTALHWMTREMDVHELLRRGEPHFLAQAQSPHVEQAREGAELLALLRKGLAYIHGVDREGRPCLYVRPRLHHANQQSAASLVQFSVYLVETLGMMLRAPVDTATLVFDLTDVALANVDLSFLSFLARVFNNNYPETLGQTIIYRPPWLFHSLWRVVKAWLPGETAAKFLFLRTPEELARYLPAESIPRELGGAEDWEWRYIEPDEGPQRPELQQTEEKREEEEILRERERIIAAFERETVAWLSSSADDEQEGGGGGRDACLPLAEELAENYWQLDPYFRARSVYDRLGMIGPHDMNDDVVKERG